MTQVTMKTRAMSGSIENKIESKVEHIKSNIASYFSGTFNLEGLPFPLFGRAEIVKDFFSGEDSSKYTQGLLDYLKDELKSCVMGSQGCWVNLAKYDEETILSYLEVISPIALYRTSINSTKHTDPKRNQKWGEALTLVAGGLIEYQEAFNKVERFGLSSILLSKEEDQKADKSASDFLLGLGSLVTNGRTIRTDINTFQHNSLLTLAVDIEKLFDALGYKYKEFKFEERNEELSERLEEYKRQIKAKGSKGGSEKARYIQIALREHIEILKDCILNNIQHHKAAKRLAKKCPLYKGKDGVNRELPEGAARRFAREYYRENSAAHLIYPSGK